MSNKPHFLINPQDSSSWQFRMDCMAWELFTKKTKQERDAFIQGQPRLQEPDFQSSLYRVEAWWMLTYLNHHQIECDLAEMPNDRQTLMREYLRVMRKEIKRDRQLSFKTFKGGNCYA